MQRRQRLRRPTIPTRSVATRRDATPERAGKRGAQSVGAQSAVHFRCVCAESRHALRPSRGPSRASRRPSPSAPRRYPRRGQKHPRTTVELCAFELARQERERQRARRISRRRELTGTTRTCDSSPRVSCFYFNLNLGNALATRCNTFAFYRSIV